MSQDFVPAAVFHVAEILQGELEARGWTLDELKRRSGADGAGCLALDFLMLRDPRLSLDGDTAGLIAKAFGTSAEFWLRVDETWRKHPDRQDHGDFSRPSASSEGTGEGGTP